MLASTVSSQGGVCLSWRGACWARPPPTPQPTATVDNQATNLGASGAEKICLASVVRGIEFPPSLLTNCMVVVAAHTP